MARDNRMMIRADAKAIGAVTAQSVRVSERWQPSTNHDSASPCISYFNRDRSDATLFHPKPRDDFRIDHRTNRRKRAELSDAALNYVAPKTAADLPALYVD